MTRRGKRGGKRDDDGRRVRETSEERFLRASNMAYKYGGNPTQVFGIDRSVVGITADGKQLEPVRSKSWQGPKVTLVAVDEVNEYWDSLPKESR